VSQHIYHREAWELISIQRFRTNGFNGLKFKPLRNYVQKAVKIGKKKKKKLKAPQALHWP
jgi:hypothetical protein